MFNLLALDATCGFSRVFRDVDSLKCSAGRVLIEHGLKGKRTNPKPTLKRRLAPCRESKLAKAASSIVTDCPLEQGLEPRDIKPC